MKTKIILHICALIMTIACLNLNSFAMTVTVNSGGGADATSITSSKFIRKIETLS